MNQMLRMKRRIYRKKKQFHLPWAENLVKPPSQRSSGITWTTRSEAMRSWKYGTKQGPPYAKKVRHEILSQYPDVHCRRRQINSLANNRSMAHLIYKYSCPEMLISYRCPEQQTLQQNRKGACSDWKRPLPPVRVLQVSNIADQPIRYTSYIYPWFECLCSKFSLYFRLRAY